MLITNRNMLFALLTTSILILSYIPVSQNSYVGNDSFFHVRYSTQASIFDSTLPWMYFTNYREFFPNHHLLFHQILKVFTFSDPYIGAKCYVLFTYSALSIAFYKLLSSLHVRFPEIWTVILFVSSTNFLVRISMIRVQAISIVFMLIYFYALLSEKKFLLFIISVLYTWLYFAFIYIFYYLFIWFLLNKDRSRFKLVLCSLFGIALGTIFNPYFPNLYTFIFDFIYQRVTNTSYLPMGAEWYHTNITSFFYHNFVFVFVNIALVFYIFKKNDKRLSKESLFFFFIMIFYFILFIKSSRFIEYLVPVSTIFCALLFNLHASKKIETILRPCYKYCFILVVFVLLLIKAYQFESLSRYNSFPFERFKSASEWIQDNSLETEIIYNVSWSDFPQLFYWNNKNYYICGLDPNFLEEYDKKLSKIYLDIMSGEITYPGHYIRNVFGCRLAIVSKRVHDYYNFKEFIAVASNDPLMLQVYEDDYAIIYRVNDFK